MAYARLAGREGGRSVEVLSTRHQTQWQIERKTEVRVNKQTEIGLEGWLHRTMGFFVTKSEQVREQNGMDKMTNSVHARLSLCQGAHIC
jgi:CheY-like chemotaxis protein